MFVLAASSMLACTCFPEGPKRDLAEAGAVFRGTVSDVTELPNRPDMSRGRHTVTFLVSEYWKGASNREVTVHIADPGTDCIGAHFDKGKEYVVFALSQTARDYFLEDKFWYGWLDVLPAGARFLTVNNFCDSTDEAKKAGKTLRVLGKGSRPHL
jgi:hypothetical protein